jgi:CelD/BcsL family acetyltransferase involved in cellulose biosynthesis
LVVSAMTVMTALDVRARTGIEAFDLPEWRSLLERDVDKHIFNTPEWQRVWWEEFCRGKELVVLTMHRGDDLTAVVPLYVKFEGDRAILRFVGGIDLTDYLGPICTEEDERDVADALVAWLGTTEVRWDEFDAHNMPVPFGFADFLVETADRAGFGFGIEEEETTAILRLPDDFDTYLAALDKKERHELKRKRRRILREHPDMVVRTATPETLEADLKTFVEMHRGTEGLKGHFMKPEIATFFERVARAFMPLGWLRLDLLEIGSTAIASTFGFVHGDTFYLYNSTYEPDFASLSPGVVLVSSLIEQAIDEGVPTFDFLRGPERYKYRFGAQPVPLNNVRVFRSDSAVPVL